jgi:SAM-dependent methyltransferase
MKTKQTPLLHPRQMFLEWYHVTTFGQILQTIEATYLQASLKLTYNQKTLQVGLLGSETLYVAPEFRRGFAFIDRGAGLPSAFSGLIDAAADELPIASESIDTVILPHVIEFEDNRHQILREAERVLKPEGRLFILGLNPWSPHGIVRHLPYGAPSFRRPHFVSRHRLLDWLSLLKFDAELSAAFSLSCAQVLSRPNTLWTKTRAELSFAYALKAVKRRYTLIPIRPRWIATPSLATGHMFKKDNITATNV